MSSMPRYKNYSLAELERRLMSKRKDGKVRVRRNYTKAELKKKKDSYFRGEGVIRKGRRSKSTIEYIVRRTFESLPKALREYLEPSKEYIIANQTNQVWYYSQMQDINPYISLAQMAIRAREQSGVGTKEELWFRLRSEHPQTFASYNAYMRRKGLNPKQYFMENVEHSVEGSLVTSATEIEINGEYHILEIDYDYSGGQSNAIFA